MAEFRNLVLSVITMLFFMVIIVFVYVQGVSNGGYLNQPDYPGLADLQGYVGNQTAITKLMSNGTQAMASSSPTTDAATGISNNLAIGGQTITLMFDSLKIMLGFVDNSFNALRMFGVPEGIIILGKVFLSAVFMITILAAIFKWWL